MNRIVRYQKITTPNKEKLFFLSELDVITHNYNFISANSDFTIRNFKFISHNTDGDCQNIF